MRGRKEFGKCCLFRRIFLSSSSVTFYFGACLLFSLFFRNGKACFKKKGRGGGRGGRYGVVVGSIVYLIRFTLSLSLTLAEWALEKEKTKRMKELVFL